MHRPAISVFLGWLFCCGLVLQSEGNPILVGDRPNRLDSEFVRITVGKRYSEVIGDYVFVPLGPPPKTYQVVSMEFPMIVPDPITSEIEKRFLKRISVKPAGGRGAIRTMRGLVDDDYFAPPGLPKLPAGWRYAFVNYWVDFMQPGPLNVRITYRQPHLPGGIAAYLPILPKPSPTGRYVIRFQPIPGMRLEPVGKWPGTSEVVRGQTSFSATPRDRRLLQIRVVRNP